MLQVYNVYQVIIDGNQVVYECSNKKPALRKALSYAKNKSTHVELWYLYSPNKRTLVKFWN